MNRTFRPRPWDASAGSPGQGREIPRRSGSIAMKGSDIKTQHIRWSVDGRVGTVTLDRPERKNPLTFESYGELRELFRLLTYVEDVKAVVLTGACEDFSSGADEIGRASCRERV